jgi:hypothetical protein
MKTYTSDKIIEAIGLYEKMAEQCRSDAGFGGRRDDGGASRMIETLNIFETMWDGNDLIESRVPKFFLPTLIQVDRTHDPEYQQYLRLKEKFD